ncbi:ABC transporter ATP-binding protein [Caldisericum sp.]|uniref:ABC transporter ATP-binding protein n=1 Tax=Caldisericum sp. TaxID=2499687 RepID=UPI003D09B44E
MNHNSEVVLKINSLTHYFGGLRAVYNFNLEMHKNEIVGLIGPNGAGKTTIFNLITGVYKPTEGKIEFKGENIIGLYPHQIIAKGIARTFQNIRLFGDSSVLDNVRIAFYSKVKYTLADAFISTKSFNEEELSLTKEALDLLEIVKLREKAKLPAKALSYGERRKLEIARALATRPDILLLDEPAAGMNPNEIDELNRTIKWLRDAFGLTILLVEHQMRLVMSVSERIIVMDFGEIIAEGTPEKVRTNQRVLEAYLGKEDFV